MTKEEALKVAEASFASFAAKPYGKEALEGAVYGTIIGLLGPRRLAKGVSVGQKIARGETITYRDGYRLIAAVSALAATVTVGAREINRHLDNIRKFTDTPKPKKPAPKKPNPNPTTFGLRTEDF